MLIKTVTETRDHYNMINKGDRIIVALSGGADSVCLLHVLNSLKTELDFRLDAIHINHCIRGTESDEDEEFCNFPRGGESNEGLPLSGKRSGFWPDRQTG